MYRFLLIKLSYILKSLFLLLLLLFSLIVMAQQQKAVSEQINDRGEVYLLIDVPNQKTLNKLNKVSSIDKPFFTKNSNKVYAYVSKNQIEEFEKLGLDYLLQTPPSLKLEATMCPDLNSVKNWNCYPTYNQYISLMNEFVANYPDLCQLEEIGTSVDGRSVLSIKISDNASQSEEEPAFFYTSTMHGDEVTGYPLMLRLIDYLLNNYDTDSRIKELVDNTEIWINPLANPDGTYAAGNLEITGATRSNSNGYDLNRNFPDPQSGEYPNGTRQKETLDMMDFMTKYPFVLSANFHGGAEVVNYPWDTWYSSEKLHADNDWYINLSRQYADTVHGNSAGYMTGFDDGITHGADWYSIDGGRQDYVNYYLHSRETTIELTTLKIPDASILPEFWNYNYRSFINYIDRVHLGLYGKITDVDANPIKAKMFVENHDKDSSGVYSNANNGMYYRLIMGGSYNISYSAAGFITKTYNNVSFSDTELKRLDVVLERAIVSVKDLSIDPIELKSINNPFQNYILADISLADYSGDLNISLYDSNGRLCKEKQLYNTKTGNNSLYLETNNLPSGLYVLHVSTKQFAIRKKMVKP